MFSSSVLGWLLLGVLVFWAVGAYNRLVRLRSSALQAFGALDAQLLRHAEVVQSVVSGVGSAALPLTDAATEALAALQAASTQFAASLAAARAQALNREAMAALAAARNVLQMAWQNVQDLCGPLDGADAAGTESPSQRWEQWATQSQQACVPFNDAVARHNTAVSQFPALLLARLFGFKIAGSL